MPSSSFLDISSYFEMMGQYPALILTSILTLAVILVNGWTDAPNAIATCVSTRAMRPRPAIIMAAVFNFLGVLVMTLINKRVAETIYNMVDFGGDAHEALVALCAAMVAIVTWATAAWKFGIPTSESHALIAGLSGAAIAHAQRPVRHQRRRVAEGDLRPGALDAAGLRAGLHRGQDRRLPLQACRAAARPTRASARRRSAARRPWPSCTARRTARSSSACSSSAWRSPAATRRWARWRSPSG